MAENQSLFGFIFNRKEKEEKVQSFVPKGDDSGATTISAASGGAYGTYVDLDGTVRSEADLVTRYRDMSLHPECDAAVDEIVNESISIDEETIVDINLDDLDINDKIKSIITDEFYNCLKIIEFNKYAYDIYRRWYIDGRLYYHVVVDPANQKNGIKEIRYIDPRKMRKVREVTKKPMTKQSGDAGITKVVNEYYIYNDKGFSNGNKSTGPTTTGLKISKDAIIHTVSGLTDTQGKMVLSHLHKAIKALNQLRTLEDAVVIYRISRAPERRIWYIDVGNLPKMKAEQYVREIMVKHKNRLIYDASSGEVRDDRRFMTMLEDYWLPRREGGRGTEVSTLPPGQNLGQMDDVLYFQKRFLQSLNVPSNRLNNDTLFSMGRATEITRDEVKFNKFIIRLRARFSHLFYSLLEKQLVLKQIMTVEEWQELSPLIKFKFANTSYFTELKKAEIDQARISLARDFQDMAGKYYSHKWVRRNVLQQTDTDIDQMDGEIGQEQQMHDPRWFNPMVAQNDEQMSQMSQAQGGEDQASGGNSEPEGGGSRDENADKLRKIQQAQRDIDMLETKKGRRTPQEETRYRSLLQVVAKNRGFLKSMGISV
tara:strand:- start:43414 stop:45201 length:1788 start_codon:yes stop_codon:yes gene_type:complete